MTREQDKFMLRLPDGMRDRLKEIAQSNMRSLNAEIVFILREKMEIKEKEKGEAPA